MKKSYDRSQALVLQPPQPLHSQATIRIVTFWRTLNHIAIPRLWMVYGDLVCKELLKALATDHYAPFTKASSRNRFPPPKQCSPLYTHPPPSELFNLIGFHPNSTRKKKGPMDLQRQNPCSEVLIGADNAVKGEGGGGIERYPQQI